MLLSCQRLIMSRHTRLSCAVAAGTVLTGPHTETKTLIVAANGKEYCRVRPLRCYVIFKLQCCCENGTCDSPSLHVFIDAHVIQPIQHLIVQPVRTFVPDRMQGANLTTRHPTAPLSTIHPPSVRPIFSMPLLKVAKKSCLALQRKYHAPHIMCSFPFPGIASKTHHLVNAFLASS